MIEVFLLFAELWSDLFSWLVYPMRIPALVVASALLLRVLTRRVLPAVHGLGRWAGEKLARVLGSVLLAPEYGCTLLLARSGRGFPLVLRLYGHWVENTTDLVRSAGRLTGRGMQSCSRLSARAVCGLVLVYLVLYNLHAIGGADDPATGQAPVLLWWDSVLAWADDPRRQLLVERV